ncbi:Hypothetical Protein RRSL_03934 [Ralstonia solanacearum UW551]|uniref:Uncharacterized protein n=2 Tax=Ralstonia solanacearum TaxID=305 RepID=A0ABF7RCD2_RALSL|nr:Hypothetical Protein RRSL_03934 [Ralstonia solanacearum UW551]CEJ18972.1 hypothetical protein RSIPO_04994 [Ralstonia solanacearum IPO1609]
MTYRTAWRLPGPYGNGRTNEITQPRLPHPRHLRLSQHSVTFIRSRRLRRRPKTLAYQGSKRSAISRRCSR